MKRFIYMNARWSLRLYIEILFQFELRDFYFKPAAFYRFIFIIHLYVALRSKVVFIKEREREKRGRKIGTVEIMKKIVREIKYIKFEVFFVKPSNLI